jgi:hypothetical protein
MQAPHFSISLTLIPNFHEVLPVDCRLTGVVKVACAFVTAGQRPIKITGSITQQKCLAMVTVLDGWAS